MTRWPGARLAVLLVDDEPRIIRAYARHLKRHDITTAGSVAEARALVVSGYLPDVVVSDFDLGDGSGLDVLEEVLRVVPAARRYLLTAAPERVPPGVVGGLAERVIDKIGPEATRLLATL